MVSLNLNIPQDFFEEETRCDYVVSKKMKEVWGVELDLLNEIIRVCKKHDIKYCVIGGTLLGAVRHDGFIPWDDDIDIMLSRKDYQKLCEVAEKEFSKPYFFQTMQTDFGFRPFARLRNSETTGIQRREVGCKIPYNQGIWVDIFPYDNLPDDPKLRKKYIRNIYKIRYKAAVIHNTTLGYKKGQTKGIKGIVKDTFSPVLKWIFDKYRIPNVYYRKWEKEVQKYNDVKTKEIGMMFFYRDDEFCIWDADLFKNMTELPFEMLMVSAPLRYEEVLSKTYGNWREYVVGTCLHGDMFFDTNKSYKEYINEHGIAQIQE